MTSWRAINADARLKQLGFNPAALIKYLNHNLTLSYQDGVLCLYHRDNPKKPFYLDFNSRQFQHRLQRAQHEQLIKACRIKKQDNLRLLDTTCGLGRDAMLLQQAGFQVTACERHPVLAALLADGLERVKSPESVFKLILADARTLMQTGGYDVLYLDPMFPVTSKSARVKKDMYMLQQLHDKADDDTDQLFAAALAADCQRVVLKRPQKAPLLTKQTPTFQINGKTCRFDVYQRS